MATDISPVKCAWSPVFSGAFAAIAKLQQVSSTSNNYYSKVYSIYIFLLTR